MAASYVIYTAGAAGTTYSVPFPYIDKAHVFASSLGNTLSMTWLNSGLVTIPGAVQGASLTIYRATPSGELTSFSDGTSLSGYDLNTALRQARYISEEAQDAVANKVGLNLVTGTFDFAGRRLTNVNTPTSAQDGATKDYVDSLVAGVTKASIGLGSVSNTADADKPVSTAQATALAQKLDVGGAAARLAAGATLASDPAAADSSLKVPSTGWVRNLFTSWVSGVASFMGRTGAVTLSSADVNTAMAGASLNTDGLNLNRTDQATAWITRPNVTGAKKLAVAVSGGYALDNLDVYANSIGFTGNVAAGGTLTSNGLVWGNCANLPSGTDLNSVTQAGFYDCDVPANAPYAAWGYLEVIRYSATNSWVLQRWTPFGTDGGTRPVSWSRKHVWGTTWGEWYPTEGFVTPQHYGAAGDGVADDTNALSSALNSGFPVRLDGIYRITMAIGVSMLGRNGLRVEGSGSTSKIVLDSTTARLAITDVTADNPWGANQDHVILRDFFIVPNANTSVDVLVIAGVDGSMGSSTAGLDMRNVHIEPSSTANGSTGKQVWLHNMRNCKVQGCSVKGRYGAYTGWGFHVSGGAGSAPVELKFSDNIVAHVSVAFRLEGSYGSVANDDWQGIAITNCEGIAVDRGVWASSGAEAFSEWLKIHNCHFYFREVGVYAPQVRRTFIADSYFIAHGGDFATSQGINTDINTGASHYGQIHNNHVTFEACTSATRIGIYVQSGGASVSRAHVDNNMVVSATTAYSLSGTAYPSNNQSV